MRLKLENLKDSPDQLILDFFATDWPSYDDDLGQLRVRGAPRLLKKAPSVAPGLVHIINNKRLLLSKTGKIDNNLQS